MCLFEHAAFYGIFYFWWFPSFVWYGFRSIFQIKWSFIYVSWTLSTKRNCFFFPRISRNKINVHATFFNDIFWIIATMTVSSAKMKWDKLYLLPAAIELADWTCWLNLWPFLLFFFFQGNLTVISRFSIANTWYFKWLYFD